MIGFSLVVICVGIVLGFTGVISARAKWSDNVSTYNEGVMIGIFSNAELVEKIRSMHFSEIREVGEKGGKVFIKTHRAVHHLVVFDGKVAVLYKQNGLKIPGLRSIRLVYRPLESLGFVLKKRILVAAEINHMMDSLVKDRYPEVEIDERRYDKLTRGANMANLALVLDIIGIIMLVEMLKVNGMM